MATTYMVFWGGGRRFSFDSHHAQHKLVKEKMRFETSWLGKQADASGWGTLRGVNLWRHIQDKTGNGTKNSKQVCQHGLRQSFKQHLRLQSEVVKQGKPKA